MCHVAVAVVVVVVVVVVVFCLIITIVIHVIVFAIFFKVFVLCSSTILGYLGISPVFVIRVIFVILAMCLGIRCVILLIIFSSLLRDQGEAPPSNQVIVFRASRHLKIYSRFCCILTKDIRLR